MAKEKFLSVEEGRTSNKQHVTACSDCPMRRDSVAGWLGGYTPEEYGHLAHSDEVVACHVVTNQQCAGVATYRRNICKMARPPNLELPKDTEKVFSNRVEFLKHHNRETK